jgi:hypothetical protein
VNKGNALHGLIGVVVATTLAACSSGGLTAGTGSAGTPTAAATTSTAAPGGAPTAQASIGPTAPSAAAQSSQAAQPSAKPAQPAATCSTGTRACPIRITFAQGAFSAQAHGQLTEVNSELWFVVDARANQSMVAVVEGAGATRGVVTFPNGQTEGQPGGRVFDGVLPASGDYKIHVTESPMGEGWSGRVDVVTLIY